MLLAELFCNFKYAPPSFDVATCYQYHYHSHPQSPYVATAQKDPQSPHDATAQKALGEYPYLEAI